MNIIYPPMNAVNRLCFSLIRVFLFSKFFSFVISKSYLSLRNTTFRVMQTYIIGWQEWKRLSNMANISIFDLIRNWRIVCFQTVFYRRMSPGNSRTRSSSLHLQFLTLFLCFSFVTAIGRVNSWKNEKQGLSGSGPYVVERPLKWESRSSGFCLNTTIIPANIYWVQNRNQANPIYSLFHLTEAVWL